MRLSVRTNKSLLQDHWRPFPPLDFHGASRALTDRACNMPCYSSIHTEWFPCGRHGTSRDNLIQWYDQSVFFRRRLAPATNTIRKKRELFPPHSPLALKVRLVWSTLPSNPFGRLLLWYMNFNIFLFHTTSERRYETVRPLNKITIVFKTD